MVNQYLAPYCWMGLEATFMLACGLMPLLLPPAKGWKLWAWGWWSAGMAGIIVWSLINSCVACEAAALTGGESYTVADAAWCLWCVLGMVTVYFTPRIRYLFFGGYLAVMLFFCLVVLPLALHAGFE